MKRQFENEFILDEEEFRSPPKKVKLENDPDRIKISLNFQDYSQNIIDPDLKQSLYHFILFCSNAQNLKSTIAKKYL